LPRRDPGSDRFPDQLVIGDVTSILLFANGRTRGGGCEVVGAITLK